MRDARKQSSRPIDLRKHKDLKPSGVDLRKQTDAELDLDAMLSEERARLAAIERLAGATAAEQQHLVKLSSRYVLKLAVRAIGESAVEDTQAYQHSRLIDMLVPMDRAEDMHANLEELFPRWVRRHGPKRAKSIRRNQIAILIVGTWWDKGMSAWERLLKVLPFAGS